MRSSKDILGFASDLFGAPFARVIRGERQAHSLLIAKPAGPFSLPPRVWAALGNSSAVPDRSDEQTVEAWNAAVDGLEPPEAQRTGIKLTASEPLEPALAESAEADDVGATQDADGGSCYKGTAPCGSRSRHSTRTAASFRSP